MRQSFKFFPFFFLLFLALPTFAFSQDECGIEGYPDCPPGELEGFNVALFYSEVIHPLYKLLAVDYVSRSFPGTEDSPVRVRRSAAIFDHAVVEESLYAGWFIRTGEEEGAEEEEGCEEGVDPLDFGDLWDQAMDNVDDDGDGSLSRDDIIETGKNLIDNMPISDDRKQQLKRMLEDGDKFGLTAVVSSHARDFNRMIDILDNVYDILDMMDEDDDGEVSEEEFEDFIEDRFPTEPDPEDGSPTVCPEDLEDALDQRQNEELKDKLEEIKEKAEDIENM